MKFIMPTDYIIKISEPIAMRHLEELRDQRLLSQTAKKLGISNNRLTELLRGTRKWSAYFLAKFMKEGILDIKQILQGRKLSELPREDRLFLLRQVIDDETVELIFDSKTDELPAGVPQKVKGVLKAMKE